MCFLLKSGIKFVLSKLGHFETISNGVSEVECWSWDVSYFVANMLHIIKVINNQNNTIFTFWSQILFKVDNVLGVNTINCL